MPDNSHEPSFSASAAPIFTAPSTQAREIDDEDRRWQLEWARRNIED